MKPDKDLPTGRKHSLGWALPVVALLLVIALRIWVINVAQLRSDAMEPSFKPGCWVVVNKLRTPRVGDVVIFKIPASTTSKTQLGIARVAAVPGDSIRMFGGILTNNGKKLAYPLNAGKEISYALRLPHPKKPYPLNTVNLVAVRQAILSESLESTRIDSGKLFIDDRVRSHFTFRQSYYWLLTDLDKYQPDSRHLGLISRNRIVGVIYQ